MFCFFNKWIDSIVYFYTPLWISITNTATSHKLDPLALKLLKDSWPGVSISKNPGI